MIEVIREMLIRITRASVIPYKYILQPEFVKTEKI